jgi:hypothetical protein
MRSQPLANLAAGGCRVIKADQQCPANGERGDAELLDSGRLREGRKLPQRGGIGHDVAFDDDQLGVLAPQVGGKRLRAAAVRAAGLHEDLDVARWRRGSGERGLAEQGHAERDQPGEIAHGSRHSAGSPTGIR